MSKHTTTHKAPHKPDAFEQDADLQKPAPSPEPVKPSAGAQEPRDNSADECQNCGHRRVDHADDACPGVPGTFREPVGA